MPTNTQTIWKYNATTAFAFTIIFALIFAAMRAAGTLGSISLRPLLPLSFVLMTLSPWLLLKREGRREIGFQKPLQATIYLQSIFFGAIASLASFAIGIGLFGSSADNWYISIAANFSLSVNAKFSVLQHYLMFTIAAMIFSPIGEEIFFRGVLQRALENRFSTRVSTWIECAIFGLVHLCHHGIVLSAAGLTILPRSAPIWFVLMFAVATLFSYLRKRSASLYPAIVAHSMFNFTMGTCIFLFLWPIVA